MTKGTIFTLFNHKIINEEVVKGESQINIEAIDVYDGYHSMKELYFHRMALFVALSNTWTSILYDPVPKPMLAHPVTQVWKSKLHSDGTIPFDDPNYFIAGMQTQFGQITYHMQIERWWDKFKCPELSKAPKYDGHNSEQVVERLLRL